jgi:hypothetical protein
MTYHTTKETKEEERRRREIATAAQRADGTHFLCDTSHTRLSSSSPPLVKD